VLTLALATGATTAVYSVVDGVLLQPLPFAESDRLVRIWESNPAKGQDRSAVLPGSLADWSARSTSFEGIASYSTARLLLTVGDGSEYIRDASVSRSLFSTLGVQPVLGRVFLPDEWASVISDRLWRRKFGADPNVIGKNISFQRLGHAPIVGVMPPGFDFPGAVDSWSPADVNPASRGERGVRQAIAKLKPGVTVDRALVELKGIARQAERDHPDTNAGWTVVAEPLLDATVGNVRPALLVLLAAVGCLLLIGCANLGSSRARRPVPGISPCARRWAPRDADCSSIAWWRTLYWRLPGAPPAFCPHGSWSGHWWHSHPRISRASTPSVSTGAFSVSRA
jgi:hypothetical protein